MKKIVCFLVRNFYRFFYSIEINGISNVPDKGRLIIASNHISNNDPPLILSFLAKKRLDFSVMAKKELFKNPIFGHFIEKLGAIKTDRQNISVSSIKKAIQILSQNGCLLIFPEGTRAKNQQIVPKSGISYLIAKTQSNVLPVKISYVKNNNKLSKIIIIFGRVIPTAEYDFKNEESFKNFSQYLMEKIYSL
ncbi:MAG: 1-acyl-sn-glycerol-3-phosphate acyltransferase [Elusimicrobiales bacterium]|nr:1-acyl-sn-glycerol-3-phosphate acyltransferase [Elusimicrobiales bacterium]